MGLLRILGLCALAACCGAVSVPQLVLKDTPLLSRGCNDSDVLSVSGFALQNINRDQKDGYVLSLNRVSRVWEHTQDHLGSVFYLVLDVLQTGCHVLSKKAWQDCADPAPGTESPAGDQGPSNLPKAKELQQKITPATDTPSKVLSTGVVQHLPDLDDEKPEGSQGEGPPEAFPVQLELTTNPQGELLDVSFLFLDPAEVKLVILPFPKEDQHSGQCPGPAQNLDPLILPP